MEENTDQPLTTPLGNPRSETPGNDNVVSTPPQAPTWDRETPLEDITKQYTDLGSNFIEIAENSADNVGDRQVQLVGNDFGATNPYMYNTYYEPTATEFASQMRQQGTQAALEEGLDRGEDEAKKRLNAAKSAYSNALAAAKEQQKNAKMHVSETDSSKLPKDTTEQEFIKSEEYKKLSDEEREARLEQIRIQELQNAQTAQKSEVKNWNDKDRRTEATNYTLKQNGITREEYNKWDKKKKDAFWADPKVGNTWTKKYMLLDFYARGKDEGDTLAEEFGDIESDVKTIVDAVNKGTVSSLSADVFKTSVASSKPLENQTLTSEKIYKVLHDNEQPSYKNTMEQAQNAYNAISEGRAYQKDGKWYIKNKNAFGADVEVEVKLDSNSITMDGNKYHIYDIAKKLKEANAWDKFAKGEYSDLPLLTEEGKETKYSEKRTRMDTMSTEGLTTTQILDKQMRDAFGVDYTSLAAIADLKKNKPDDFEYLLNQTAYVMSAGGSPISVVTDKNKKYFINGKWWSASDENSPIKVGDLIFHTVDGTVNEDGSYRNETVKKIVDLYQKIYTGKEEATDENKKLLTSYMNEYQTSLAYAMAATGRAGMQVQKDIYSSILAQFSGADESKIKMFNPENPDEEVTLNDVKSWFESFNEDEQYNIYTAITKRAASHNGYYYIYDEKSKSVKAVPQKQNGIDTIGKYGKTSSSENMSGANMVDKFSDDQCFALKMYLDHKMKKGEIKSEFFDNDEVSAGDSLVNQMWNGARGLFTAIGSLGKLGWGIITNDKQSRIDAGKMWDEMTTLNEFDNMNPAGGSSRTDAVLFNEYTEDIRKMQRSNLNHLIDSTFNLEFFNPENEYDAATGVMKDKNGNVIAYDDNHYFHNDVNKAISDMAWGLAGFVAEAGFEALATGGAKLLFKGAASGVSKTKIGASLAAKTNRFRQTLTSYLHSEASIRGIMTTYRSHQAEKFVRTSQAILRDPTTINMLMTSGKTIGQQMVVDYYFDSMKALSEGADSVAKAAIISNMDDLSVKGSKAAETVAGVTMGTDLTGQAARTVSTHVDDAGNLVFGKMGNWLDDIADDLGKGADDAAKALAENELKQASSVSDDVVRDLKKGVEDAGQVFKEQYGVDKMLNAVVDNTDDVARTASQKIADYIDAAFKKLSPEGQKLAKSVYQQIDDISYESIRRAAQNVTLSEASGISIDRIAKLDKTTTDVLYDILRSSRGSELMKTDNIFTYMRYRNFFNAAGTDAAQGTIDFAKATEAVVNASESAAGLNKTLGITDTLRIVAKNSTDQGDLFAKLKSNRFWRERIRDYADDIFQGYRNPELDESFESHYTSLEDYVTDPTQWIMGAVFDGAMTGARKLFSNTRLMVNNKKLSSLVSKIEFNGGVESDSADLSRKLRKMNKLKYKVDRLTDAAFDGSLSYDKVSRASQKASDAIDDQLTQISDHFNMAKSLDFMDQNLKTAAEDSNFLDRIKGWTGFGTTKVAAAADINRLLVRSDDTLRSFIYSNDALKSRAVEKFAKRVYGSPNTLKFTDKQFADGFCEAWQKVSKTDFAKQFGVTNGLTKVNGKYTHTINVADKVEAKRLFQAGQDILWDAYYDAMYAHRSQFGDVINWQELKTEFNAFKQEILDIGFEMIDNGQPVRWDFFPSQGILWQGAADEPEALVGYFYGAGEHTSLASNMTDPLRERDTIDMSQIVADHINGKTDYERKLSFNEELRAQHKGEVVESKTVPYNERGFNPIYALTAYTNSYNSRKFVAPYIDPFRNGAIVIADDDLLNARVSSEKLNKTETLKKYRSDLEAGYKRNIKVKMTQQDIFDTINEARTALSDKKLAKVANYENAIQRHKSKLRDTITSNSMFKQFGKYTGIDIPTNALIAEHIDGKFLSMVDDIRAVAKKDVNALSPLYKNKNSVQYRNLIDGLAKNPEVKKDLANIAAHTIDIDGQDLHFDAFNSRYYGVIGVMEATQRHIDYIESLAKQKADVMKTVSDMLSDERIVKWNAAQEAAVANMDNVWVQTAVAPQAKAEAVETFAGNWTAGDVKRAKDKVFLFGDNIEDAASGYVPTKTQAVIRGQENAIGIPTKKNRGYSPSSYFTDADFDEFKAGVDKAITEAKESGKTIVLPENGIGTGAAQLKQRAPRCFEYLQNQLDALKKYNPASPNQPTPTKVLVTGDSKTTAAKAKEIGGVDVLRHPDANGMHYGNPFSPLDNTNASVKTKNIAEAVDNYRKWLKGEAFQDVEPKRRQWIIDQINSGALDGKTLVYYTDNVPGGDYYGSKATAKQGKSNMSIKELSAYNVVDSKNIREANKKALNDEHSALVKKYGEKGSSTSKEAEKAWLAYSSKTINDDAKLIPGAEKYYKAPTTEQVSAELKSNPGAYKDDIAKIKAARAASNTAAPAKPVVSKYDAKNAPNHAHVLAEMVDEHMASTSPAAQPAGTFEASTAGHKEFSALNAKFAPGTKIMGIDIGGRTIEDVYQNTLKGSGKNQAPAADSVLGKATADAEKKAGKALTKAEKEAISQRYYDRLWDIWGEQNPGLKAQIENLPAGTKITDQFAKTGVSQANSLQRWVKPATAAQPNTTARVKVISGGQTGVDTIGLEVGKELGLETGGTATPGFYREKNIDKYTAKDMAAFGLKEIDSKTQAEMAKNSKQFYLPRTRQNVINSDGTVYFASSDNSAGYKATKRFADTNNKPFILNPTASQLREWMISNNITTLNVAGSRGSHIDDNFRKHVKDVLGTALKDVNQADTAVVPKYSAADFVTIHDIDEKSKREITSIIYDIVANKYGEVDIDGKKRLTSDHFKKMVNQFAYDAYDTVALGKSIDEGITAAEVLNEFNNTFPDIDIVDNREASSSFDNIITNTTSFQNAGGTPKDLRDDILSLIALNRDGKIKLSDEELTKLIVAYREIFSASDAIERVTNRGGADVELDSPTSKGRKAAAEGDEALTYADVIASDADYARSPEEIMIAQQDAEEEAAKAAETAQTKGKKKKYDINKAAFYEQVRQHPEMYPVGKDIDAESNARNKKVLAETKAYFKDYPKGVEIAEETAPKMVGRSPKQKVDDIYGALGILEKYAGVAEKNNVNIAYAKKRQKYADDWKTFNNDFYPKYTTVVDNINKHLPEGVRPITKVQTNHPLFQTTDSNWLRIVHAYEDANTDSFRIGNKDYGRKDVEKFLRYGIDGRGAIEDMNPKKLRAYVNNNGIKLNSVAEKALSDMEAMYDEFAMTFTDAAGRRQIHNDFESVRSAIINMIAADTDPAKRILRFDIDALGINSAEEPMTRADKFITVTDADGSPAEVRLVVDYGTGNEGSNTSIDFWFEKTDADGNITTYRDIDDLAETMSDSVTGDDIAQELRANNVNIPDRENRGRTTDYFAREGKWKGSYKNGTTGVDLEDWEIDKNIRTGGGKNTPVTTVGRKEEMRRLRTELAKYRDVPQMTPAEKETFLKAAEWIATGRTEDSLAPASKRVYRKYRDIYPRIMARDRILEEINMIQNLSMFNNQAGWANWLADSLDVDVTNDSGKLETALYGNSNKQGYIDRIKDLTAKSEHESTIVKTKYYHAIEGLCHGLANGDIDYAEKDAILDVLRGVRDDITTRKRINIKDDIINLLDETIYMLNKKYSSVDEFVEKMVENNPTYKMMKENINSIPAKRNAGQIAINYTGDGKSPVFVNGDADMAGRISIKQLREARELVAMNKDGKTPLAAIGNRRKDKKILASMRDGFTDGYTKKQLVGEASFNKQNNWIDNLVNVIKENTGIKDIDESKIFVDRNIASLGQTFFGEGTAGWQERLYKLATSLTSFNQTIQDLHLAGGLGQYNAFTLRNALTMMWQDPIGGTRALIENFRNAKDNQSVISFLINNSDKLLKYSIDSGDFSAINKFAPIITMRQEAVGRGAFAEVVSNIMDVPTKIAESEHKLAGFKGAIGDIYRSAFNTPTFARWTVIANADLTLRNYNRAAKYVDRLVRRFGLTEDDFANMDGGMGSKDRYIATLARLRTEMYWQPQKFWKTRFNAQKYLDIEEAANRKRTVESLRSMPKKTTAADAARSFFFAINYKLQMNMHPVHGLGSVMATAVNGPRMMAELNARRTFNLATSRFAGGGNRNEALTLLGLAFLAHAWNTAIGAPSAWSQLWSDTETREGEAEPRGLAKSLMNFQDFFKIWIPDSQTGMFDPEKSTALDPAFSIFTMQNSFAKGFNALTNPDAAHISPYRNDFGFQNWTIGDWEIGRGIEGAMDEVIGANLLAGYKAGYEVFNNNTYFGNNVWELTKLPDGTDNPNHDALRNLIASVAHILNLDGALEGNGILGSGTNRWVKGLDIDAITYEKGHKLEAPKSKGWAIGKKGVYQDKTGTVSGSGLIQHEYTTALAAINDGDYFEALSGAMELPFKSRSYVSRARTALNSEVTQALRRARQEYEMKCEGATSDAKDIAYAQFAKKAVGIVKRWSREYDFVLGDHDELVGTATKILLGFMSGEFNDTTNYMQNMYMHLKQELKMAEGDKFLFKEDAAKEAMAAGMDPKEAAETWNKHLTALKEAQMREYKARLALEEAGIESALGKGLFDSVDYMYDKYQAEKATIDKKIYTELKGVFESKIGEFKDFEEMKKYYEELIKEAGTTKQKAKLADKYNKYVTDAITPYVNEYGGAVLNSAYWDGDYVTNHFGKYVIIPADEYYNGTTPRSSYLRDQLGIGFRDNKNLPSDKNIKEELNKVSKALAKGQNSSAAALVDAALLQLRKGVVHASPEDHAKLIRMRALLSSRRK